MKFSLASLGQSEASRGRRNSIYIYFESLQGETYSIQRAARYATHAYLDWNEISIMQMRGFMECVIVCEAELLIRLRHIACNALVYLNTVCRLLETRPTFCVREWHFDTLAFCAWRIVSLVLVINNNSAFIPVKIHIYYLRINSRKIGRTSKMKENVYWACLSKSK